MDKFNVTGPTPLNGTIPVSGSKNAALPLMAASILGTTPTTIRQVPLLKDIYTFNNVIRVTGARVDFSEQDAKLTIDPENISHLVAPYDLVRKMRASFYMLGALLGKFGQAKVSLPGGCAWGPRPVDLHLEGLKKFGADIELEKGYVVARAKNGRLDGGEFKLEPSSVGATVNLLLASVTAAGTSVIQNAAREPDVVLLCNCLKKMGAQIEGIGTQKLAIQGVPELKGAQIQNAPDRIETGTFMIAGAMHPESEIKLTDADPGDLGTFLDVFPETGADVTVEGHTIKIKAPDKIQPVSIETQVYPGFPTDLQAQWATMMTQAEGTSVIKDTIYNDRFSYVPELKRLGADMQVEQNAVEVQGPSSLKSASVMSTDLRASVSLVLAAMVAKGTSEVLRIYHLDRGYEKLEHKLNNAGAQVSRINNDEG